MQPELILQVHRGGVQHNIDYVFTCGPTRHAQICNQLRDFCHARGAKHYGGGLGPGSTMILKYLAVGPDSSLPLHMPGWLVVASHCWLLLKGEANLDKETVRLCCFLRVV